MCGRFSLTADPQAIQQAFVLSQVPDVLAPRYNIAPTQPVSVITNEKPQELTFHRWGLVPSWSKDIAIGNRLINARSEGVEDKPSFRAAFKRRRCLIPSDGFFEWRQGDGKNKIPHFIFLKEHPVFAFAGLWEVWRSPEGDELRTCTILTTDANPLVEQVHNRMPVILHPDDYALWLSADELPAAELKPLLRPFEAEAMDTYAVSPLVNRPANDVPEVVRPVA